MNDKRWNAMKRALARHGMHIPMEAYFGLDSAGMMSGWKREKGICPVSLMKAKAKCPPAIEWNFKDDDPIGDCDVCDAEDD